MNLNIQGEQSASYIQFNEILFVHFLSFFIAVVLTDSNICIEMSVENKWHLEFLLIDIDEGIGIYLKCSGKF